jgi:hypothetical protein
VDNVDVCHRRPFRRRTDLWPGWPGPDVELGLENFDGRAEGGDDIAFDVLNK